MRIRKIIDEKLEHHADGVDVVGGIQGVIAGNVGAGTSSRARVSSHQRIVQTGGKTLVEDDLDPHTEVEK